MTNIQTVERELRAALDSAIEKGAGLAVGDWGIEFDPARGFEPRDGSILNCAVCALGAWALTKQPIPPFSPLRLEALDISPTVNLAVGAAVSSEWGWSTGALEAFTSAWDGDVEPRLAEACPEIVDLAQRLAVEYVAGGARC